MGLADAGPETLWVAVGTGVPADFVGSAVVDEFVHATREVDATTAHAARTIRRARIEVITVCSMGVSNGYLLQIA